ncbi:MAG: DUF5610 domain-containing protein [Candidatus Hinthialibacter antarcticus]|nr:DUF5610 domain-containing protein [Candidatus Hinthialibacter antarcticus]
MILLIDPVSNQSIHRPASYRTEDLIKKPSKVEAGETVANKGQRETDQVSISFNLQGDLSLLQQSVDEVQSQVRNQLEEYFGIGGEETQALGIEFLPPEDASASALLDFFSPENTAERIVGFATSFFGNYAANHSDEDAEAQLEGFTNLISAAIKEGFGQAQGILGDLSGEEEVAQNINRTFSLVTGKIEEFRLENFNKLGLEPEPVQPTEDTEDAVEETEDVVDPLA